MGVETHISWCEHTFNPWIGCTKITPACDGCYAWAMMDLRYGRVEFGGPGKGVGTRQRTSVANWRQPIAWNKVAAKAGTRPFVFCASLADVFDNAVDPAWRRDLFDLIRATPHLVWLLLTKRPQNIVRMVKTVGHMPPNIAFGTTCEDQLRAGTNLPHLIRAKRETEPAFAFVSCEPLIDEVDLWPWLDPLDLFANRLDWVITGGETDQGGHAARATHPDWFRSLRDQCAAADVPYHHKQNGEWIGVPDLRKLPGGSGPGFGVFDHEPFDQDHESVRVGKRASGRMLDGVTHDAFPVVPPIRANIDAPAPQVTP